MKIIFNYILSRASGLVKDSNKHKISKVIKRNRKELKISVYIKGYTEERIIYIKDKANLNFSMFHTARKNTQILPNALLNEPIHKLLVIVSRATKTWLLLYLAWNLADVKLLEQFRSSFLSLSLSLSLSSIRDSAWFSNASENSVYAGHFNRNLRNFSSLR